MSGASSGAKRMKTGLYNEEELSVIEKWITREKLDGDTSTPNKSSRHQLYCGNKRNNWKKLIISKTDTNM